MTSLGFSPEQPVLNVKSHPNPKWPSQSAAWPVQLRTLDVLMISSLVFYFLLFIWVNPSSFRNFSVVIPGTDALGLRRSASYERFILEKVQGEGCKKKHSWTSWFEIIPYKTNTNHVWSMMANLLTSLHYYFTCMGVSPARISASHVYPLPAEVRRRHWIFCSRSYRKLTLPCHCLALKSGPLQEHPMLLTGGSSLQPHDGWSWLSIWHT